MASNPYVVMAGTACTDEYYTLDHWIGRGDKISARFLNTCAGGMIANAACILSGMNFPVYFLDIMKPGKVSDTLLCELNSYGVDTSLVSFDKSLPDVKCFVYLSENERTVIAVDGEKISYHLDTQKLHILENASVLYTTLYNFQNFKNCFALLAHLKSHHVKIAFDIEAHSYSNDDLKLISQADILFFNSFGFQHFCGDRPEADCAADLLNGGTEIICVTLGENGCQCFSNKETFHISGFHTDVLDTTGAGDTFNACFLKGILTGNNFYHSALYANACAALNVSTYGPRSGAKNIEKLRLLKPLKLTEASFKSFGRYIQLTEQTGFMSHSGSVFYETKTPLTTRPLKLGITYSTNGAFICSKMERHLSTEEILFCGNRPMLLAVSSTDPHKQPDISHIHLFLMEPFEAVVLNPGIWHDACHAADYDRQNGCTSYYFMAHNDGTAEETTWHDVLPTPAACTDLYRKELF